MVDVKTRYLPLEKVALALIHITRQLPHYFQAHTIYVLIEYPLQALLRSLDFAGRVANWGATLGSFGIKYRPRNAIKGQVLADFLAEFASINEAMREVNHALGQPLRIYVDGASNAYGLRVGVVLESSKGIRME